MAVIPQPIYTNQGGGSGGGGDFLSQLLLTLASQGPQTLMAHLARKDENARLEAKGQAALPAITQLGQAAAMDPSLSALAASVGAFGQLDPQTQLRSGADFLAQSQDLMTALTQQKALGAQTQASQAATASAQGAEQRAQQLFTGELQNQTTANRRAQLEADHFHNMAPLEEAYKIAQTRAMEAQAGRDWAAAGAATAQLESYDAQISLARDKFAHDLETTERAAYMETVSTLAGMGVSAAAARTQAAMLHYGTPNLPSVADLRADAQARAAGGETNMFARVRENLINRVTEAGYPMTPGTADQLDKALLNAGGDAQAAMDQIVASQQLGPDELPIAAVYLSGAAGQRVVIQGPKPTLTDRLRRFLGLDEASREQTQRERQDVMRRRQGSGGAPLNARDLQRTLDIGPASGVTNYMQLDSAGLEAQLRESAANTVRNFSRPPQR